MDRDELGDRMKMYEQTEAGRKTMPLLPTMIRLDGKGFSRWTKGLSRPYDERLSDIMVKTTDHLVDTLNARVGYTQSDEITLVLYSDDYHSETIFSGKIQKLVSVSASIATAFFNSMASKVFPDKPMAYFDSRVWNVPNKTEAMNVILWREQDAKRNSISMAAQTHFSHRELQGKNTSQMLVMLREEKDIDWDDYPESFKWGTFVQRRRESTKFSPEEIERLPAKHEARKNPELEVVRNVRRVAALSKLLCLASNRVEVIFDGEDPRY